MTFKIDIINSPVARERVLQFNPAPSEEEVITMRAAHLAEALKGRYVRRLHGYSMTPYALVRWELLYDAGYHATRKGGHWKVWLEPEHQVEIHRALRTIRAARREAAAQRASA